MAKEISAVQTAGSPAAIGPYSQAIRVGELVFTSGQIPLDPETGALVSGGFPEQAERAMENLKAVVEASGGTMARIVKATCFLADMGDFPVFNDIYGRYFAAPFPARSCVEVARLPKDVRIEVEAIVSLA